MKQKQNETRGLDRFKTREVSKQILKFNKIKCLKSTPTVVSCKMLVY